jgi:hypothetical protein
MKALIGDRLVIASNRVDAPAREGRIIDVRGQGGEPPYLVEWADNGHQALVFPGPDAHIEHVGSE